MPAQREQHLQQVQQQHEIMSLAGKQTTNVKIVWRQPLMKHPTALWQHDKPNNVSRLPLSCRVEVAAEVEVAARVVHWLAAGYTGK